MSIRRFLTSVCLVAAFGATMLAQESTPLTMVVMDPLALQLSCPCVKGYAQRDYEKLAKHLESKLGRPVNVYFSESLAAAALKKKTGGKADIIIGKESVVRHECKTLGITATPLLALSGKDGKTTMTGMFVVAAEDKALTVSDLKDHRLFFGPAEADEKHASALALLKDFEVAIPKSLETCNSCSDGAIKVLEAHKEGKKFATVISSYAQPLLEGCGTIKKGELRVVGETDPVPFVVAFVTGSVSSSDRAAVESALRSVGTQASLCTAMETKLGFVELVSGKKK